MIGRRTLCACLSEPSSGIPLGAYGEPLVLDASSQEPFPRFTNSAGIIVLLDWLIWVFLQVTRKRLPSSSASLGLLAVPRPTSLARHTERALIMEVAAGAGDKLGKRVNLSESGILPPFPGFAGVGVGRKSTEMV